jgi:NAD(P)H-flavin reductase
MLTILKTKLNEKKLLVNNIYSFSFSVTAPQELNFIAGQYLMLKVPKDASYVSRLYSIASTPKSKNKFELIVEIVPNGLGSTYLDSIAIGQEVEFMGPGGVFFVKKPEKKKIFLVTGTGIAPVRSMLLNGMENYELFWGLKTYRDVYLLEDIKPFNPTICLSREENLDQVPEADKKYFALGHVDACFEKKFNNLSADQLNEMEFYLCGGRHVVESLRIGLLAKNVLRENILFEKF